MGWSSGLQGSQQINKVPRGTMSTQEARQRMVDICLEWTRLEPPAQDRWGQSMPAWEELEERTELLGQWGLCGWGMMPWKDS